MTDGMFSMKSRYISASVHQCINALVHQCISERGRRERAQSNCAIVFKSLEAAAARSVSSLQLQGHLVPCVMSRSISFFAARPISYIIPSTKGAVIIYAGD
jgi:hypothetical protein